MLLEEKSYDFTWIALFSSNIDEHLYPYNVGYILPHSLILKLDLKVSN